MLFLVKSNPELSIRRRQSNLNIVFIFVSSEEKDCYRVVSVGQVGLTATRTASTVTGVRRQANHFFVVFFFFFFPIFESGGITKHLMTGPSGNGEFCFLSTLRVSGKQNSLFPLRPVIKCLFIHSLIHSFLIGFEYRTKQIKPSLELQGPETESAITRVRRLLDRSRWWFPW